jgi:hypothetical protein
MRTSDRQGFRLLGVGAAACVACCAGPILAFLGGLGVVGLAGTLVVGAGALVLVAVAAAGALAVRRRRAAATCGTDAVGPVAVEPPTRTGAR